MPIAAAAVAGLVIEILMKAFPPVYKFIKAELDGGADAQKLRDTPVNFSISFGGGEGDAVKIQRAVEDEMLDPDQD
ncbi:hypothetical protein LCGC14_0258530 [marine sediment metagenome]|uniref:Uncharacterized protein n=1 Tax=marine sediment metagenome TaxID=412755 RepID=A0A0F9X749_9ZZZZ